MLQSKSSREGVRVGDFWRWNTFRIMTEMRTLDGTGNYCCAVMPLQVFFASGFFAPVFCQWRKGMRGVGGTHELSFSQLNQININNIDKFIRTMYFICSNVKVSNVEYHYHGRSAAKITKLKPSSSKIRIFSRKQSPNHQTDQTVRLNLSSAPSPRHKGLTLLEKIRRKEKSLATTLMCTRTHPRQPQHSPQKQNQSLHIPGRPQRLNGKTFETRFYSQIQSQEGSRIEKSNFVVEQSAIFERNYAGRFTHLNQIIIHEEGLFECLAVEQSGLICCLKSVSYRKFPRLIMNQLQTYTKISFHPNILELYYVYQHEENQIFAKEPFTGVVHPHCDIPALLKDVLCALKFLQRYGIFMDYLNPSDVCECFGTWKLANLSKILQQGKERISVNENISHLEHLLLASH